MRNKKSFTFIELLLVVIIISVLAAMVTPRMAGRSEEARRSVAKADIESNIPAALKMYEYDNGAYPTTDEGLQVLLTKTDTAKNWKGPYLEKKPVDPWKNLYQYRSPGDYRDDYDLFSLGRDGIESGDDVVNWEEE